MNINFSQQVPLNSQMVYPQTQYGPYYPAYSYQNVSQNSQFMNLGEYSSDFNCQAQNSDINSNPITITFKSVVESNLIKIQNKFSSTLIDKLKCSFDKNEKLINQCGFAIENQKELFESKMDAIKNNIDYLVENIKKLDNRVLLFTDEKTEILNKQYSYLVKKEEQLKLKKEIEKEKDTQIEEEFYKIKYSIEENVKFVQNGILKFFMQEEEASLDLKDKIIEKFNEIKNNITSIKLPKENNSIDENKSNISLSVAKLADIKNHVDRFKINKNNFCLSKENISLIGKFEESSNIEIENRSKILKITEVLQNRNFSINQNHKKKKFDISFYQK